MKTLILAGGLGTRLRGVISKVPKPMAPVAGRPFLDYLIAHVAGHGLRDIVISTGHLAEHIRAHFTDGRRHGVTIRYCHEEAPLGTGGAVKLAEPLLGDDDESFLVMNGDSFLAADLGALIDHHRRRHALATLAVVSTDDTSRYGGVELAPDGAIVRFTEKGTQEEAQEEAQRHAPGLINGGIYVFQRSLLAQIPGDTPISLERTIFPALIGQGFFGLVQPAFFVDIGVPATYRALDRDPRPLIGGATGAGAC